MRDEGCTEPPKGACMRMTGEIIVIVAVWVVSNTSCIGLITVVL